jgi:ABC-2 type transport system ATP-binding protein
VAVAAAVLVALPGTSAADTGATVRTLHFAVRVGPTGAQSCDVIGDVYTPAGVDAAHPAPAILTTNGFGGSKDDLVGLAQQFAGQGYVVLAYSGLGFGGSGCKITLDDPDWDGRAASQLISFLGGDSGIAFTDPQHTQPVAGLDDVRHDATDHNGQHRADDPRVGMIGGSYGGEIQFATASVDPRLDTIIPQITWNDLSYSLAPNNTDLAHGVTYTNPGAAKLTWSAFFFLEGSLIDGLSGAQTDPSRLLGCPNFADPTCADLATTGITGFPDANTLQLTRHASVENYASSVRIPTLLAQGEDDTLFNLNEAVATYQTLKAQGTPVKMIWQLAGHSGPAAPGESDYTFARYLAWFDHYLKGLSTDTGPDFAYFQDWVNYTGSAAPAYGQAASYPAGAATPFYLSGNGSLVSNPTKVQPGSQSFLTLPAGLPSSTSGLDAVGGMLPQDLPDADLPGSFAAWTSAPLTTPLDVVGTPTLDVRIAAPTAQLSQFLGPAGQLVLFAKVYDVDASGNATLIHHLIAPVRIADVGAPVHIVLPALVHQFAPGHQIRVVVAGGDLNYRGGLASAPVTIAGSGAQVLTLPVVGATS